MPAIIFVCTGNMCRSPMAEGILKVRLAAAGRTDFHVSSMGIHGLESQPASTDAITVSSERGIDLAAHIARGLVAEDLTTANLIFVMEPVHKEFLRVFFPRMEPKVFLLGSWPDLDHRKGVIKDPTGKSIKEYRKTFDVIELHIDRIFPFLLASFPGSNNQ